MVPATERWTDTGIDLSTDDSVLIEADGTALTRNPAIPLHGPRLCRAAGDATKSSARPASSWVVRPALVALPGSIPIVVTGINLLVTGKLIPARVG